MEEKVNKKESELLKTMFDSILNIEPISVGIAWEEILYKCPICKKTTMSYDLRLSMEDMNHNMDCAYLLAEKLNK